MVEAQSEVLVLVLQWFSRESFIGSVQKSVY